MNNTGIELSELRYFLAVNWPLTVLWWSPLYQSRLPKTSRQDISIFNPDALLSSGVCSVLLLSLSVCLALSLSVCLALSLLLSLFVSLALLPSLDLSLFVSLGLSLCVSLRLPLCVSLLVSLFVFLVLSLLLSLFVSLSLLVTSLLPSSFLMYMVSPTLRK